MVFLLWKHHPTQWGTVQFSSFSRSSGRRNQVQTESQGTIHNFWQYRQEIAVPKWICIIYPSSLLCYFMLLDLLLTQKVRSLAMSPMSSIQGQFVLWLTTVLFLFFFLPYHLAYGILVPQPGIEPMPPDLGAQSLNHWTTKEIPGSSSWRPMRSVRPRLKLGRWVTGLLLRAEFLSISLAQVGWTLLSRILCFLFLQKKEEVQKKPFP